MTETARLPALLAALLLAAPGLPAQEMTPDAMFQDGINSLSAKKFAEAEATFRKLRALEPGNVRGVVGTGQTLMAQGKFEAALQYATAEVARDTANPKLNLVLGDLAAQCGQLEIAAVRFQRALDLLRTDPNADTFFVKRSSKRFPEAAKQPYEAALDNFIGNDLTPPGPGGIYFRLADVFLKMGDGPRGVAALENAHRVLPADPSILLNLGMIYELAHEGPRALAAYRDLIKIQPDAVPALNNAAFLIAESNGNLDEALRYALHAQKLQPQTVEITDTIGWVRFKRKEYEDAIVIFAKLVRDSPEKPAYREHLRATVEATGNKSLAAVELKRALSEPPSDEGNRALSDLLAKMFP